MSEEKRSTLEKRLDVIYRTGRISHAYILEGDPEVTGAAAEAFAKKLVTSPADVLRPEHERPGLFSVDDVRRNVQGTVYIRPYGNARKVYILRDAELLNAQAQNALLKTIEEPPEYAVILLCTKNAAMFLETILSRCVILSESDGMDDLAAENEELSRKTRELLRSRELSETAIQAFVKEAAKEKQYLGLVTETVRYWFRDVLYLKCGGSPLELIYREERNVLTDRANRLGFGSVETILRAVDEAEARLDANVSPELTLQMLFSRVAEALRNRKG